MKLLLHICCSNCALYPFKIFKSEKHDLTALWFNPNIHPFDEYKLRLDSLERLSNEWGINVINVEEYKPEGYFKMFNPSPDSIPPSPERCRFCYNIRLEKTAEHAQLQGFDAFSSTLLISPYQNFEYIVSTGKKLAEKYNVFFYPKDFRPYFREAMALSKELGLYRQKYCGCIFSMEERKKR